MSRPKWNNDRIRQNSTAIAMTALWRRNEASFARSGSEAFRPVACVDPGPIRRFFDLQSRSIWQDLSVILPKSTGKIVDVGCGAQPYRRLIPSACAYIGIDVSSAESNFGYSVPDTIYFADNRWPPEDSSVDVILATETLEHVSDPNLFLEEAARVSRPTGTLILTVPFAARWHYIPHDYWRFTPSGLKVLLENAGFFKVEIYARGNEWTVLFYKVISCLAPLLLANPSGKNSGKLLELIVRRILGIGAFPFIFLSALIGALTLKFNCTGDDCLGYTVVARRQSSNGDPSTTPSIGISGDSLY
jgi:SAM-dependent methyltransferase